jgi:hypothetical protein
MEKLVLDSFLEKIETRVHKKFKEFEATNGTKTISAAATFSKMMGLAINEFKKNSIQMNSLFDLNGIQKFRDMIFKCLSKFQ